jgi:hypothetical protein
MNNETFTECSPIFIIGSPRSGTTLTRSILSSHRNIAIADGFHYWVEVAHFSREVPDLKAPGALDRFFALLDKSRHYVHIADLGPELAEVRAMLERDPQPTAARYFRYAMEIYARRRGAERFGEKTSANVRYLRQVQEMFPNGKIINLVRDPRANVASHLHVPWASRDVVSLALKWKLAVRAFLDFQASGPARPENVLEVKYEELAASPEPVIRQLCAFVGEPFDPHMLAHQEHSSIDVADLPWKQGVTHAINEGAIAKWRQELTGPRIALIQWLTGPEMRHYGYAPIDIPAEDLRQVPAQMVREIRLWLAFKRRVRAERRQTGPQYYDDAIVYRLMLKLLGQMTGLARRARGAGSADGQPLGRPSAPAPMGTSHERH